MLRKLLVITLLLSTVAVAYAQKKDRKKKKNKGDTEQVVADTAKIDYKAIGAPLPPLKITTRTGEKFTDKDFKSHKNLLVMMFNPTCDHCQEETTILEKNIEQLKDTKLLLVAAPSMIDYLEFYNNVTRYSKYPEITVGVDSAGFIDKTFNYTALPQINIYDKDRKLVKIFSGVVQFDALEPYVK
jgi:thiol-disulfide isomerase/thioredoxin